MIPKSRKENLVRLVGAGNFFNTACNASGISQDRAYEWMRTGKEWRERRENGEKPNHFQKECIWFLEAVEEARSKCEAGLVAAWFREGMEGDWRAAERFLSKAFPERWSESPTRLEISSVGGPQMNVIDVTPVQRQLDHEKKRQVLEALVEAGDLPGKVLEVWDDGDEPGDGSTSEVDGVEAAVRDSDSPLSAPEAASILELDDD